MSKCLPLSFLFFIPLLISCGNSIIDTEEVFLKRPLALEVLPLTAKQMKIRYFIQNQESSFNGYNLYISKATIADNEINNSVLPLNRSGSLPTFVHSVNEFNIESRTEVVISLWGEPNVPFEPGITYFFRMTAVSFRGNESIPSNQVNAITIE